MSKRSILVLLLAAVAVFGLAAVALSDGLQRVPAKRIATVDGTEAYAAYCESCHGADGKGNGKAAAYLKVPVPDLTTIATRHGRFDRAAVMSAIEGPSPEVHREMPHWSGVLAGTYHGGPRSRLLLRNLVQHLETLQTASK